MTSTPLRIGFVGCGTHATAAWYPNFFTIPELELRACCDVQPHLAERNARFFGAPHWYTDLAKMLDQEALDAVMVVGPDTTVGGPEKPRGVAGPITVVPIAAGESWGISLSAGGAVGRVGR